MTSEIKRRFTDTEMQTARETDLPELLTHLGYQVKRIGRYYTTAETAYGSRIGAPGSATLKASAAMRSHSCSSSAIKLFRRQ